MAAKCITIRNNGRGENEMEGPAASIEFKLVYRALFYSCVTHDIEMEHKSS
jgi:hypothetical protein